MSLGSFCSLLWRNVALVRRSVVFKRVLYTDVGINMQAYVHTTDNSIHISHEYKQTVKER